MFYKKTVPLFIFLMVICNINAQKKEVTFGLAGDVMLGRGVNEIIKTKGILYPWGTLLPHLRTTTDFNMVNLETAITKSTTKNPEQKAFYFRFEPNFINTLLKANIQAVNLANNHVNDFNTIGLQETIASLDKNNIYHVGAGMNLAQAQQPAFFTKNGIKFGILGFTDNEPSWAAHDKKPGINYSKFNKESAKSIKDLIITTKKKVDFLIVSLHWGGNWEQSPSQEFKDFAHAVIDAGADIIHGHSPHIFQGIELYKNKLIFYSCGDFLDDYAVNSTLRNDESFLFIVTINEKRIQKLQLIPVIISNRQVNQALNADAKKIIQRMQNLTQELGTLKIDDLGLWLR